MGRFRKARVIASAGVLLAGVWGASMALFTDTATSSANFTAGTLDLTADSTTVVSVTDMAPGDTAYGALTLTNSGTLDLRYAMSTTAGVLDAAKPDLGTFLVATVKSGVATCDAAGFAAGGTVVAGPGSLSSLSFGDATPGAQTGDRDLAPGNGETLCFQFDLPSSTGNGAQGGTASATFTFAAEQTKNN